MKLSFTVSKILLTAIERGGSFKKEIPQVIEERFKKQPRPIKEDIDRKFLTFDSRKRLTIKDTGEHNEKDIQI